MNQVSTETKQKSKILAFLCYFSLGFRISISVVGREDSSNLDLPFLTVGAGLLITIPWAWIEALGILVGKYSMGPKILMRLK